MREALRPVMILLKYAACVTAATPVTHLCMSAPMRYPASQPRNPSYTHTHRSTTSQRAREGVQSGLRCKTPPACFNFHLPHQDPMRPVTQVAPCCTSLLLFSSPVSSFFLSSRAILLHTFHSYGFYCDS